MLEPVGTREQGRTTEGESQTMKYISNDTPSEVRGAFLQGAQQVPPYNFIKIYT